MDQGNDEKKDKDFVVDQGKDEKKEEDKNFGVDQGKDVKKNEDDDFVVDEGKPNIKVISKFGPPKQPSHPPPKFSSCPQQPSHPPPKFSSCRGEPYPAKAKAKGKGNAADFVMDPGKDEKKARASSWIPDEDFVMDGDKDFPDGWVWEYDFTDVTSAEIHAHLGGRAGLVQKIPCRARYDLDEIPTQVLHDVIADRIALDEQVYLEKQQQVTNRLSGGPTMTMYQQQHQEGATRRGAWGGGGEPPAEGPEGGRPHRLGPPPPPWGPRGRGRGG